MPRFLIKNKVSLKSVHHILEKKGFSLKQKESTYGVYTRQAVKRFQMNKKLSVDGIIGPKTWRVLKK